MQTKTPRRYYTYLLKWPKSKTPTPPNPDKDVDQPELAFTAGGDAKWKTFGSFFTKLNAFLPYDPASALHEIYSKEIKKNTFT